MIRRGYAQPFAIAGALALGLATASCGNRNGNSPEQGARGTSGVNERVGQSITVSGCLQQRAGGHYILTNIHTTPAATSGKAQSAEKAREQIERDELSAAEHSYRLSGQEAALKNMLGHEISVTGTVVERSNLQQPAAGAIEPAEPGATGTAGTIGLERPITPDDLAKIQVNSVDDIALSCR
jgi:hypothetical protein